MIEPKVYFFSSDGFCEDYKKEKHAKLIHKFLFFEKKTGEKMLVVGSQETHKELFCQCQVKNEVSFKELIGAGDCKEGFVVGWRSVHFEIVTAPRSRRELIKNLLQLEEKVIING